MIDDRNTSYNLTGKNSIKKGVEMILRKNPLVIATIFTLKL